MTNAAKRRKEHRRKLEAAGIGETQLKALRMAKAHASKTVSLEPEPWDEEDGE